MSIRDIIDSGANITIAVSAADLKEFAVGLVAETRRTLANQIAASEQEVYLSAVAVCKILDVNRSTLCRWAKSKYLQPAKVGGLVRYKKSDIDRILKKS